MTDPPFSEPQLPNIRLEFTDEISELVAALAPVQAGMGIAKRGEEGQIGNQKYAYADLAATMEAVGPALGNAGIAVFAGVERISSVDWMCVQLTHTSGQYVRSRAPMQIDPNARGNASQAYGSAMTYSRRYVLMALLNVATEDDDGRKSGPGKDEQQQAKDTRQFPSDTHGDTAPWLEFHRQPGSTQRQQLGAAGFVWNPKKTRWEAPPSSRADVLGESILANNSNLVKAHHMIGPAEGAEDPPADGAGDPDDGSIPGASSDDDAAFDLDATDDAESPDAEAIDRVASECFDILSEDIPDDGPLFNEAEVEGYNQSLEDESTLVGAKALLSGLKRARTIRLKRRAKANGKEQAQTA